MLTTSPGSTERGSALVAAIAIMVICAIVIVAVMINGMSSRDRSRSTLDRAATEALAREAGNTLASIYSAAEAGEFDNFVPRVEVLTRFVSTSGGAVEANPADLGNVDPSIPESRRRSVCRSLDDGRTGCWQLFAVKSPTWGVTKAGAVTIYVRAWTRAQNGGRVGEPTMFRIDARPTWLSDYQAVNDGKMYFGENASINGRVHSNGRETSFFHVDRGFADQIELHPTVTCGQVARITTTAGSIKAPHASCQGGRQVEGTRRDVNLLRATALVRRLRAIHATIPAAQRPNVQMADSHMATGALRVVLNGSTVTTSAGDTLDASIGPGNNGAVVISSGDVLLSGNLADGARALVVAMSREGQESHTSGSAPSVTIRQSGTFGASTARSSSLGVVAEGDVIIDTENGGSCPFTARGAFVAVSGMVSIDRKVRVPYLADSSGAYLCDGEATIEGSIAAHYSSVMWAPANNAGFAGDRTYTYLGALFDNPPPMFPTAFDWQVSTFAPADLRCFDTSGRLATAPDSGCVA